MVDDNSLERLYPDDVRSGEATGEETLALHLERYEFAAAHARVGRLLDIACGSGYGTRLIKDRRSSVLYALGVDVSEEAVAYAKARYEKEGIHFLVCDAMTFADPERFDTVVCLETLEHLPSPEQFLDNLVARVLCPGGILVCSAPVTPSVDANPHHMHDFTERSFRRMFISRGMTELACLRQVQRFRAMSIFGRREARTRDIRKNVIAFYFTHPSSLARRAIATVRHGLCNCYCTIAWSMAG